MMLYRVDSMCPSGRSDDLLKLKPRQDPEVKVIRIFPVKVKFSGMMGALLLKDKSGHIFRTGTSFSYSERQNRPPPGSAITYKFTGTSKKGLLRFACILRMYQL